MEPSGAGGVGERGGGVVRPGCGWSWGLGAGGMSNESLDITTQ